MYQVRALQLGCAAFVIVTLVFGIAWASRTSSSAAIPDEQNVGTMIGGWLSEIHGRARTAPHQHFANLPRTVFARRLAASATKYGFAIRQLRMLHPRQAAPMLVVQTADPQKLARAIGSILVRLDPGAPHPAYEGFFFEARDGSGRIAFSFYDAWRGRSPIGAQSARAENLLPFDHGGPVGTHA